MNNKDIVLITGTVMTSNNESVDIYNKLTKFVEKKDYKVLSPLDTMKFEGTNEERYQRAIKTLENTKVMIAEMTSVSTGQGMEIQQANNMSIPILVIAKENSKISGLVKGSPSVKDIIYYNSIEEIETNILKFIKENY